MTDLIVSPPPILGGTIATWNANNNNSLVYGGSNKWFYTFNQINPNYHILGYMEINNFETNSPTFNYISHRAEIGSRNPSKVIALNNTRFITYTADAPELRLYEIDNDVIIQRVIFGLTNFATNTPSDWYLYPLSANRFLAIKAYAPTAASTRTTIYVYEYDGIDDFTLLASYDQTASNTSQTGARFPLINVGTDCILISPVRASSMIPLQLVMLNLTNLAFTDSSVIPFGSIASTFLVKDINNIISLRLSGSEDFKISTTGISGTFEDGVPGTVGGTSPTNTFHSSIYLGGNFFLLDSGNTTNGSRVMALSSDNTRLNATPFSSGLGMNFRNGPNNIIGNDTGWGGYVSRFDNTTIWFNTSGNNTTKNFGIRKFLT